MVLTVLAANIYNMEYLERELNAVFKLTILNEHFVIKVVPSATNPPKPLVVIIPISHYKFQPGEEIIFDELENVTAKSSRELYFLLKRFLGNKLREEEYKYFVDLYTKAKRNLSGKPASLLLSPTRELNPKLTPKPVNRIAKQSINVDDPELLPPHNRLRSYFEFNNRTAIVNEGPSLVEVVQPADKLKLFELKELLDLQENINRPISEANKSSRLQEGMRYIADQLTKSRIPWKPISYTSKIGKVVFTIIGRVITSGQIVYEFTVFDEASQEQISSFSIIHTPDQLMELLYFPTQQVQEMRQLAKFSPLRKLSELVQQMKERQRGDFAIDLTRISSEIDYLNNCLVYEGTTMVCVVSHSIGERALRGFIGILFGSSNKNPAQDVLYLNNSKDVENIKERIQVLEERKNNIQQLANRNYYEYNRQMENNNADRVQDIYYDFKR